MIVQHFDRPSLFKTFTTDPEITRELLTDENGLATCIWIGAFSAGTTSQGHQIDVRRPRREVRVKKTAPLEFDGQTLTIYLPKLSP